MKQPRTLITSAVMALAAVVWSACGDEAPVPVASLAITPSVDTVRAGESLLLMATPRDASGHALTGRTIAWASNDQTVATVDAAGLVTGTGNGEATITATSEGQTDVASVTAWVGVTGTWMGMLDVPGGPCQLDLSINESGTAAITGNSVLYAPCYAAPFTVAGTNNTGGVTDSVVMNFDSNGITFVFRGAFDGNGALTGGVWSGSGPYDASLDRLSLTQGALAPARVAGASPTAPHWPDEE